MVIGIIGLGNMGQMLVKGLCRSRAVSPGDIVVFNRSREKAADLQQSFPVQLADSAQETVDRADMLFICTKPLDVLPVLRELTLPSRLHLVSVAAGVSVQDLETIHSGPVSKVIPTVTSEELRGVSLLVNSSRVSERQRKSLQLLLGALGTVEEVTEESVETATILTSSAPGLIAGILEAFAQAAVRTSPELGIDTARRMLVETLAGTSRLLENQQMGFDQMMEKVATKGGITEEGLAVLGRALPQAFDELFSMTGEKHALLKQKVQKQINDNKGDLT
ncbi:NAD(P)-binding domain-containing protein [Brevibacillus borstelensis]|uniref:NAD(P)-binding domain-containing protein n=1 Tax=Brevibacillus borstelensis TaxID=45462 RepID=UPI0030C01EAC